MASANTHLTHLEELVLTQGPKGYNMARAFLLELLETLKGNTDSQVQTSVKWDGAPAMFAGINPENGKFFVGTKSIFNKAPKINYTKKDIIKNHGHAPGLVDKLTKALRYLPSLGINKILQGDFMFDDEMLDMIDIDGESHYRFKPNTIVYAVPVNSELGEEIGRSKFGIVFHTTYDSLESGASFGADVTGLNKVPGIWFDDAFFTDDTGTVTLTDDEEGKVNELVREADTVNEKINYNDIPSELLNIYINSEIKGGAFLEDPEKSFLGFTNWYSERIGKKISNLKSEKGQARATASARQALQMIDDKKEDILNLFRVSRLLFEAKNIFIEKYNNAVYNTKHFVDDGSGDLVVTNPEGYVAVDHQGNGVKFVDRLEFSRANFAVDKSAKFSQEPDIPIGENISGILDSEFTVVISKNVSVTKTLNEWMQEAKTNNHAFEKLPNMVYKDILAGVPIVDIVVQENAEKAIYNTVMGYINGLQEEEGLDAEFIEDETDDPVVDVDFPKTYAIVPGAFKPPHAGHADMVRRYATGDGVPKADEVIVVISAPLQKNRTLRDGTVINEKHAIAMWRDIFPNVANLPNVRLEVAPSEMRSPITVAYEYIGKNSPLSFNNEDRVILGASKKGGDWQRWRDARKYAQPGIELLSGEEYAVEPLVRAGGVDFSATDMRNLISDLAEDPNNKNALNDLKEFVPADKIDVLFSILDLPSPAAGIEETSTVGAVASSSGIEGYAVPLGSTSAKTGKKKRKKTKQKEYIDLSLIDEVMKLIIERGTL